jgi:acetyltransferase
MKKLNESLPSMWSKGNPVDVLGDADPLRYKKAVEFCMNDPNVDGVLVTLTPQGVTDPAAIAKDIVSVPAHKTLLASWMGEDDVQVGREILEKGSVPVYRTPEDAIKCFMTMYQYSRNLELIYETPGTIPHAFVPETDENKKLIRDVMKQKRYVLTEPESMQLLENYKIPVVKNVLAKKANEAVKAASKIGFPVVMKIVSPDIMHKTDMGGVRLNIKTAAAAERAFNEIMRSSKRNAPKAKIHGVLVEKMHSKKYELLIGSKKDPIFGPVIVFGMGGVAVEVFKDMNVGLPPLNMALAMRIIEDTKIYRLLKGYRGMKGVDIEAIQFLLYKFAYLLADFPEIKEIDINPFGVDEKGGLVLDAKVILDDNMPDNGVTPYSHMVISPYPKQYVSKHRMKNGKIVTFRPIRPEDEPLEAEMFTKFSEETQRFRFFRAVNEISHELLIRFTQIDYDREIAIIAEIPAGKKKKMAGVVRLIADAENETAEFAIVVADPWQNRGLGNRLTDYVLRIAKERKIKKIYAEILRDNFAMIHILKKRGFKITESADACHAELVLEK